MILRQMAVAFLMNEEEEVLLLQKKPKDTFLAGYLVPIGGHIENNEINDPEKACFRECREETGFKKESIKKLKLRYVMFRNSENQEIRIQYVFFGFVSKDTALTESNEGSLEWVKLNKLTTKNVSETSKEIIEHYSNIVNSNEDIYVGSMKYLSGKPAIT